MAVANRLNMNPAEEKTTTDQNSDETRRPRVVESYSGYAPPFDVKALVEKMASTVPPKFLVGLEEILLTNTAGLPRRIRRGVTKSRKKKVRMVKARGLYQPKWNNRPARIEIFVDNTLVGWRKGHFWWLIPRGLDLQDVLFHEIGHHIHATIQPEHREREDVADVWKVRLSRNYLRQRHRLLRGTLRVLRFLFGPFYRAFYKKTMDQNLQRGWISRAEYDESMK
jgi:hypothetical protein